MALEVVRYLPLIASLNNFSFDRETSCSFFQWADEVGAAQNTASRPQHQQLQHHQAPTRTAAPSRAGMVTVTAPAGAGAEGVCRCGEPAIVLVTKKEGPNMGRQFYACRKPRYIQCLRVLWMDIYNYSSFFSCAGMHQTDAIIFNGSRRSCVVEEVEHTSCTDTILVPNFLNRPLNGTVGLVRKSHGFCPPSICLSCEGARAVSQSHF